MACTSENVAMLLAMLSDCCVQTIRANPAAITNTAMTPCKIFRRNNIPQPTRIATIKDTDAPRLNDANTPALVTANAANM